ncbi:valine--tRNA ligase [Candidatus Profftella armatura (Diaphorina cf. continua)]|uniref:Valine--tRNA ligase n=1 Tax=Candidatus Profftella armatura (Diaphorina cf. continua) TaxID=2661583 RepID=A0A7R7ACP6_9PROT|nr:valine--tRNA ligase [Candidatus Profftella armatura (Diaphorina cf. continua)]BCG49654.1 valine--tRNA ligase [Candidatus Profftella armatura (Diaphorina cf. continua)]
MELIKSFEPNKIENFWKKEWEKQKYFTATINSKNPFFVLQLPPPNITGILHMGHAFNQSITDSLVRYHRMRKFNTIWIPGFDHAGIATQMVIERELDIKKITRKNIGRKKFIEKILKWKEKSSSNISNQMRQLGISVDWSKEYFTMNENTSNVVTEVFVKLFEQGLIYRGKRIVNWDPKLNTAISDLEVISQEEDGFIWYIRYPLADKSDYITIATTRPETIIGDAAVAVSKNDKRYTHLIGKLLKLPLCNRYIPIIEENEYIDKTFGTGCMKITPAHDFIDYIIGEKHNLPQINIFTSDAKIIKKDIIPIAYHKLDRFIARKKIINDLNKMGLLEQIKSHKILIPRGDRTGSIIEPMLTNQWFIAVNKPTPKETYFSGKSIAEVALEKIKNNEIELIPKDWNNIYQKWLNNIQDWCISRQLWWGHQIPAWYDEDGKIYVARNEFDAQIQAGKKKIYRDEDVLDTWFSSSILPFSILGWPQKTQEYKFFIPYSILITGFDILFFWVIRMIMMTTHFTGKIPFKKVYIHGLVRDSYGKKMSKSKNNILDPIDVINGIKLKDLIKKRTCAFKDLKKIDNITQITKKEFPNGISAFGADALRFTFISLSTLGRNINFDLNRCQGYRNFCNKLWNAARFVQINVLSCNYNSIEYQNINNEKIKLLKTDRWIISLLQKTNVKIRKEFYNHRFDNIASTIYKFIWYEYCDWYLEIAKIQLKSNDKYHKLNTCNTLLYVLETLLRLAHPIIPFITEALWQKIFPLKNGKINEKKKSIMIQEYPKINLNKIDKKSEKWIKQLKMYVNACRNLRGEMRLSPTLRIPLFIESKNNDNYLISFFPYLKELAKLSNIKVINTLPTNSISPVIIFDNIKFMLITKINVKTEKKRISKEINKINIIINKAQKNLNNEFFMKKAPKKIIIKEQERINNFSTALYKLKEQLLKFKNISNN